jgi:hypothetical protein
MSDKTYQHILARLETLNAIKSYIEDTEVAMSAEYDCSRSLEELLKLKKMPPLYYKVCEMIEAENKLVATVTTTKGEKEVFYRGILGPTLKDLDCANVCDFTIVTLVPSTFTGSTGDWIDTVLGLPVSARLLAVKVPTDAYNQETLDKTTEELERAATMAYNKTTYRE